MDDFHNLLIKQMSWEAENIVSLVLIDEDGRELPVWEPGSHIDLEGPPGNFRQYSLCSNPRDLDRWRIAVLKEENSTGGSKFVHEVLRPGMTVATYGPRNRFRLVESKHYLFIAGGIGITPILPMISAVADSGADWHLHYGGRRRTSMAFLHELSVHGSRVTIVPEDEFGLLDLKSAVARTPMDTAVYCCGPEPLIAALEQACSVGLRPAPYIERFKPDPKFSPTTRTEFDSSFEVVLQKSGLTFIVPPEKSVLQAIEEAGVMALNSCRSGYCGCCVTEVLEGEVDHRDDFLFPEERVDGKTMMICVSRSRSPRLILNM